MSRTAQLVAGLAALIAVVVVGFALLTPRTFAVGGYSAALLDGESSRVLPVEGISANLLPSRIADEVVRRVEPATACGAVDQMGTLAMFVCGTTGATRTETERVDDLVALADLVMRDQTTGGAVTIAASDITLAEHRATLIADGITVLDFVGFQKIGAEDVPGLFIERKGVVEWLGLATGTDGEYLIWATAPTRESLELRLNR